MLIATLAAVFGWAKQFTNPAQDEDAHAFGIANRPAPKPETVALLAALVQSPA